MRLVRAGGEGARDALGSLIKRVESGSSARTEPRDWLTAAHEAASARRDARSQSGGRVTMEVEQNFTHHLFYTFIANSFF